MRPIKTRTTPAMDTTPASTDTPKAAPKRGPRNVMFAFWVTPEEREEMRAEARRRGGISVADLIRHALTFFKAQG